MITERMALLAIIKGLNIFYKKSNNLYSCKSLHSIDLFEKGIEGFGFGSFIFLTCMLFGCQPTRNFVNITLLKTLLHYHKICLK